MGHGGGVKELAQFANNKRDIGMGISQTLQGTDSAAVERGMIEGRAVIQGELGVETNGSTVGFSIKHVGTTKKIKCIPGLVKMKACRVVFNLKTKKVSYRTKVLEGETGVKISNEPRYRGRIISNDENVIYVYH